MPVALKATWRVLAGLHQEHIIPEYTKQWAYTSNDFENDVALPDPLPPGQLSTFQRYDQEAHEYARSITDPRRVNYVRVEFLWL